MKRDATYGDGQWHGVADSEAAGRAMLETAKHLRGDGAHQARLERMKRATTAYRERGLASFDPGAWSSVKDRAQLTYNVTRSCADTVCAKLSLHQPSPDFSTFGGSQELQERARNSEKLTTGLLYNCGAFRQAYLALRDCCLYPFGAIKVWAEGDRVKMRRTHPSKILFDDIAIDAPPGCIYECDSWSKPSIVAAWPEHKAALAAVVGRPAKSGSGRYVRELVDLIEGWQLPWGDQEPGRHILVADGGGADAIVLVDEQWTEPTFPFELIRFSEEIVGWDGLPLSEQLEGIQDEINVLLEKIRANMEMFATPFFLKPKNAEVEDEAFLTNKPFRLVEYVGQKPEIEYPPAINAQVFDQLERLYGRAFEIAGISQLSATSRKPADLESGAALRTYLDVETVRFAPVARAWEDLFVGLAKQILRTVRQISKTHRDWSVQYVGKDGLLEKIIASEAELDERNILVRVYPISALPQHPAARLERVAELARDGLIDRATFLRLGLQTPDLEKFTKLAVAPYEDLERIFEYMLSDDGDYLEPQEFQDLQTGVQLGRRYWARARIEKIGDDKIDRLERWLLQATSMINGTAAPPGPEAAQAGPQMPGMEQMAGPPGPEATEATITRPLSPADAAAAGLAVPAMQ